MTAKQFIKYKGLDEALLPSELLDEYYKQRLKDEKPIKVEVRGGIAYCSDPRVKIIDYDDDGWGDYEPTKEDLEEFN